MLSLIVAQQKIAIAVMLLGLVTLGVFAPVVHHQFLNWDDPVHATENNNVKNLDMTHVQAIFKQRINQVYIPLTTLSFAIEHQAFGFDPFIFHLDNLLLHVITVILVFFFARKLRLSLMASLGTALIFAIHPTRVESVAWVTERKDVLYAALYMGALLCYLNGRLAWCWALGLLSMLAKPMAISLPLILILLDWYQGKRIDVKSLLAKWPYVVMVAVIGAISYAPHARIPFTDIGQAPLIWVWTVIFYLRQFAAPLLSLPIHELPYPVSITNPAYWSSLLLFIALALLLWRLRKNRFIIFSVGFFAASMFFLWRFDGKGDVNVVAERFMYLPALGFCLLIAVMLERAYIFLKTQEAIIRQLFLVALTALIAGLCLLTYQQSAVWRNATTLWQHQLKYAPNAIAYNNLVEVKKEAPEYKKASQLYGEYSKLKANGASEDAINIDPQVIKQVEEIVGIYRQAINADKQGNATYRNNLADYYLALGEYDKALDAYADALKIDGRSKDAYFGRGRVYQLMGMTAQAVGEYNQLIKFYPDDEDVFINVIESYGKAITEHQGDVVYQEKREELLAAFEQMSTRKKYTAVDFYNLGFVYQQVGGSEQAIRYYSKALTLQPNYAQALYNLANLYQDSGDFKTALALYERLLRGHPKFALGYLNMGVILNSLGDHAKARQLYLKVAQLEPNNSKAYFNLGYLSESDGNLQEAINYYEKAIDADPKSAEAYYNLGNVYARLGQQGEAIAVYLKTVGINPNHQDAFVNLSILSFKSRDFKGAIRYLEEARILGYNPPAQYLKTLEPYKEKGDK